MMEFKFDVDAIRKEFPACKQEIDGVPLAHLDGPAGTQVPQRVVDRISKYLLEENANEMGFFKAAANTEHLEDEVRQTVADFLGCDENEVGFSSSSTQNSFNFALSFAKQLKPGDELIVTEIEHRCNSAPWLAMAENGMVVKTVRVDPQTQQLDLEDYKAKLTSRTRVVAVNWASNALGTVSDVKKICAMAHEVGAVTIVDAVHYSAHFLVDVKEIGTDVLLCSAYKWFGPHVGIIYIRKELIEQTEFNNVRTEDMETGIRKLHMGTPQYESLVGVAEAIEFIASVGETYTECFASQIQGLSGRRRNIAAGMLAIDEHEQSLAKQLRLGLRSIPGVNVYGPAEGQPRTPTVVFTVEGRKSPEITKALAEKGINAWDGDFYAVEVVNDVLGLQDVGGLVRLGLAPYNTQGDIDRTLNSIRSIVTGV